MICDRNICYKQDYNGGCDTCPCNENERIELLKACPLCGSDATIAHFMPEDEHAVICFDYFNESDKYETVEQAIEAWNRRAE